MNVTFEASTSINDTDAQVDIEFGTAESIASTPERLLARKVYDATANIIDVICKEMGISNKLTYEELGEYFMEAENVRKKT